MNSLASYFSRELKHSVWAPAGIFYCLFMNLALGLLGLTGSADTGEALAETLMGNRGLLLLIQILGAPVLEELLFRELAFGKLRSRIPVWAAALLSALLFAVLHFSLPQGIYAFFFGLVLAFCYQWTGSVFPCILVHALGNLTAVLVTFFPAVNGFLTEHAVLFCILNLLCLAAFLYFLRNRAVKRFSAGSRIPD